MSKIVVNTTREIVSDFKTLPVDVQDVKWVLYDEYLVERERSENLRAAIKRALNELAARQYSWAEHALRTAFKEP